MAVPGPKCFGMDYLLVDDQVTITKQVVENLLISKRAVCSQVNTTQNDLLAGFKSSRVTIDIDADCGIATNAVIAEIQETIQRGQVFTLQHV